MATSKPVTISPLAIIGLLWTVSSKVPYVTGAMIMRVLGRSEASQYLDFRSELIVTALRIILYPTRPLPLSVTQKLSTHSPPVKGKLWVSQYVANPPPETSVRDALIDVVRAMRDADLPEPRIQVPELTPVEAEWTGFRAAATSNEVLPSISEREKYQEMLKECREPTTILYFHGGAYYMCSPGTHRPVTAKLAELTGGRCYSVAYRLAPQNPFPAALLDALVSYMNLLYPPADAYHEPIRPEHIVFAGDSAGANLSLALLQLILQLRRNTHSSSIWWHGELRGVPLPAGIACNSPWLDLTQSDPRWDETASTPFDYLPKPAAMRRAKVPPCDIWPANPPRSYLYASDDLIAHPLSTLVLARNWEGAPPIYISVGWEILAPENFYLAQRLFRDKVPLVFEEYEAMPHCFPGVLPTSPSARRCFDGWSSFIQMVTRRNGEQDREAIASSAVTIKVKTAKEVPMLLEDLSTITDAEMRERIAHRVATDIDNST